MTAYNILHQNSNGMRRTVGENKCHASQELELVKNGFGVENLQTRSEVTEIHERMQCGEDEPV